MVVQENEIKIYYKHKEGIVSEWDSIIEAALSTLGFKRWASGFNLITGIRDLAFDFKIDLE